MTDWQKIKKLTSNKDKRVTLMLNNELWTLFRDECEKDGTKPTPKLETYMLEYLETKGLL